jgi:hypothetical protein
VKGHRRPVAAVAALLAAATLLLNQELPSVAAPLLLGDIILVSVVRESILTPAGTELSLLAVEVSFANETTLFHKTLKVGLRAYHTRLRLRAVSGAPVESVKFGEA